MAKILMTYGTVEGQTAKIAQFMAGELRQLGHAVEIFNVSTIPRTLRVMDYGGVLVGAPVHSSGYPNRLRKWIKAHAVDLVEIPGAFFSVCLGILQKDEKVQEQERKLVLEFFEWSNWRPQVWTILPGALPYSKYGWVKRFIMKKISAKAGGDTDTSRDYEYTDWDEVRRFVRQFDSIFHSWRDRPATSSHRPEFIAGQKQ